MRIIFAGTPEFALPSLQSILDSEHELIAVYTQPDRPAGRGRKLTPSPIKAKALSAGIPIFQPESLKNQEAQEQLGSLKADLMVVVAYGMLLPQSVLDMPTFGCINVHASLLPRWRGAAPIQRAILAGDAQTGVTIMQVALKLDAGDMLHKEILPLAGNETAAIVHDQLAELGAQGLKIVLAQIIRNTLQPEIQNELEVTYAEKLQKSEAQINWSKDAVEIQRQVLAFNPWPVAQTLWKNEALRIWSAQALAEQTDANPGTVQYSLDRVLVSTGRGSLQLLEVQSAGGRRMPIQEFIKAHHLDGAHFE